MIRPIGVVMILILVGPVATRANTMPVMDGTPDGFEHLNEPRPAAITVYYGGDVLGSFRVHFMPGAVQFDNPDEIIKAIPNVMKTDFVKMQLQQPVASHEDKMCTAKRKTECDVLTPDVIGIIFDEAHLRAELFVNKNFLSVNKKDSDIYLPLPKRQRGSVYSFNGAVNGTDANTPNFTVTNEAIHSFGEMKLMTQSTAANQGLRFDTIAGSIDRNGWNGTTGLFRSRAMDLITDRDIAGLSVSTSPRTVVDSHKDEGSNIILYLPRRSFVSIYREGRLYSSHAYDVGNQQIDTSELPEGAYQITLKIQEADGTEREESRFFAKAQELPPPNRPIYYAQAGVSRKPAATDSTLPQLTADPILQAGTVRRVTNNMGVGISMLGLKDRALIETGSFLLFDNARLNASVMKSTKGDTGVHASYQKMMKRFNISVDAREVWSDQTDADMDDDATDFSDNMVQGTMIMNYRITNDVTFGVRGNYTKDRDWPAITSLGPYAEWRIWQRQENMLMMNINAARTERGNEGSLLLSFTHRFGQYGVNSTAGVGSGGDSRGVFGTTRVWHDNQEADNNIIIGGGMTADERHRIVSGDADWRNNFGRVRGNVQEAFGEDRDSFDYGGNFSFNAAQTTDEFHLGGSQNDQSAVIIDTTGDTTSKMKIMVNDVPRGSFKVGKKQVIYLSPYHTYRIHIEPENAAFLDFDNSDRKVTVYPGNVIKMSWDINRFYVFAGRVFTQDGQPLQNATLQDSRAATITNDKGYLQVELPLIQSLHFMTADNTTCTVDLPQDIQPLNGLILYKKPLICEITSTGRS